MLDKFRKGTQVLSIPIRNSQDDRDARRRRKACPDRRREPSAAANRGAVARAARTRRLLEGPIGPTLARLAAPNVIAMLVMTAMSIAEGAYAGRLGVSSLAGLALVFPLVMLTQMLSAGAMGGAISSAVARSLGAGDADRAGRVVVAAWIIGLVAAGLSALIILLFGEAIFRALGGGTDAVGEALAYAHVFFPGCVALWLCHSTLSVIRGSGDMATPSLVLLLVSAAAIPLAGAFALGWGPFPALGMAGLGAGPVVAFGIGAAAALVYVATGRAGVRPTLRGLGWAEFRDILRVGVFASLNTMQTVFTTVVMVALVGRYGEAALAGYGLGARLEFLGGRADPHSRHRDGRRKYRRGPESAGAQGGLDRVLRGRCDRRRRRPPGRRGARPLAPALSCGGRDRDA